MKGDKELQKKLKRKKQSPNNLSTLFGSVASSFIVTTLFIGLQHLESISREGKESLIMIIGHNIKLVVKRMERRQLSGEGKR